MTLSEGRSTILKMTDKFEQRVCITFYMKLGKSASEALEILHQASSEHCLCRTQVFERFAKKEPAVTKTKEGTTSPDCSEMHDDQVFCLFVCLFSISKTLFT